MNNKVLFPIIVIILILLGAGIYVMSSRNKLTTAPVTQSNETLETMQTGPKSLKDLLTARIPQKCTFTDITAEVDMSGTTYVSGGMMRGDFNTTQDGKTTSGHSIYDGKVSYVWMDGAQTGFKMEVDPSEVDTSETSTQQGLDLNKSIDYNCSAWLPDNSLFSPPNDITFTSFEIPTSTEADAMTGNQNLCTSCDALSGEQKTQCLTALNCN